MEYNQIKTLPEEFGKLRKLKTILMTLNLLWSIPISNNHLSHLEELYLSMNNIHELQDLSGWTSLQQLYLATNKLKQLAICIIDMVKLVGLTLSGNELIFPPLSVCRGGVSAICQYMLQYMLQDLQGNKENANIIRDENGTGDKELKSH